MNHCVPSIHIASIYSLNTLEQHEHFHFTDPAITVQITGHSSIPNRLVVIGRSQAHHQTQIPVGKIKLIALQLSREVPVISLVNYIDVVSQELIVVVGVPTVAVIDHTVTGHGGVSHSHTAPSVETMMVMVMMSVS